MLSNVFFKNKSVAYPYYICKDLSYSFYKLVHTSKFFHKFHPKFHLAVYQKTSSGQILSNVAFIKRSIA